MAAAAPGAGAGASAEGRLPVVVAIEVTAEAFSVVVAVAGVGRFAAVTIAVVLERKAFRHSLIKASKSEWDQYKMTEALFREPCHGTQLGEFSESQAGVDGANSSRDKVWLTIGNAHGG
jgi:hypothetical protein